MDLENEKRKNNVIIPNFKEETEDHDELNNLIETYKERTLTVNARNTIAIK